MNITRNHLGLSNTTKQNVFLACVGSYTIGYNARLRGDVRKKPSMKSPIFDRDAWLTGYDDARRALLLGISPHGLPAGPLGSF